MNNQFWIANFFQFFEAVAQIFNNFNDFEFHIVNQSAITASHFVISHIRLNPIGKTNIVRNGYDYKFRHNHFFLSL